MRAQQVNKLYSKLTPHEQAALVFEAGMQINEPEVDLILDSVERKVYRTLHIDYQTRIQGLMQLAGLYGIYYWKTLCQLSLMVAMYSDSDNFAEVTERYRDQLAAMDEALNSVCKPLKIEPETIKYFAECSAYRPKLGGNPDSQLVDQYIDLFSKTAYLD